MRLLVSVAPLVGLALATPALAEITNYGLLADINAGPGQVVIFDTQTNATLGSAVMTGNNSVGAVFSLDGRFAYVPSVGSNSISVIDVVARTVVATIPVGASPYGIAISPDGQLLYVTNSGPGTVSVVATATNTIVGSPISVGGLPFGIAVSQDGSKLYVTNENTATVSIIDATTKTVVGTVAVGNGPSGVTVSPDGSKVYVANQGGTSVSVIDMATQTVTATISVGAFPLSVVITPDGSKVYVTSQVTNNVSVIETATNTVVATIGVSTLNNAIAITPDGSRVYVTASGSSKVIIIDTATNAIIGSFTTSLGNQNFFNGWIGPNVIVSSGGPLSVANDAALTTLGFGQYVDFNGGTLKLTGTFSSARTFSLLTLGGIIDTNGFDATLSGAIVNSGSLIKTGLGALTLSGANTYSGGTIVAGGTLAISGAGTLGATTGTLAVLGGALDLGGTTQTTGALTMTGGAIQNGTLDSSSFGVQAGTISAVLGGTGALTKTGVGAVTLSGANTYTGATTIDGGTLFVSGSIASSDTAVNSGGTLAGTGTVGNVTVAPDGILAPGSGVAGTTLNVAGNLAFQSGALYQVQVNPLTASSTLVSGSATLAGAVQALFAAGSYVSKSYTILTAANRTGTFDTLTTSGLPTGFWASLDYSTPNSVTLDLNAGLHQVGGLNRNRQNVAGALDTYFNNGGALPPAFVTIFGLTGGNLANALTQLDGEAATGAQQSAFQMTSSFLGLMTDPFVDGRGGDRGNGALGFAPGRAALPPDIASVYAAVMKAPPSKAPSFEPRWSLWGSAFGGSNRTSGEAAIGSSDLSARTGGFAAGADYQLSPSTLLGFALAGGQSSWRLAQGLGGGRSDSFQAGIHGRTTSGPAYLAGSFAFANHWMSTDRTSFASDRLSANFNAQSYGGRFEAGYRLASPFVAVTPYAAVNAQLFETPSYRETDLTGGGLGVGYAGRSATNTRGEAGARFDRTVAIDATSRLTLRAKLAYAHDWASDPTLTATFQALPGASFVVSGAAPPRDSGLASAGAEWKFAGGIALGVKFDGEFASRSQTYAGTGTLRYAW